MIGVGLITGAGVVDTPGGSVESGAGLGVGM